MRRARQRRSSRFSGGVDSSLVAALAPRALGDRALAVTAVSPAVAAGELDGRALRRRRHRHRPRDRSRTDELARPGYRAQRHRPLLPLQDRALRHARGARRASAATRRWSPARTPTTTATGGPASRAASEHGVVHPLLEAGLGKAEVRALAHALGVPSAAKPASPCLASRVPYGTPVDPATLARIDARRAAVRALGFRGPARPPPRRAGQARAARARPLPRTRRRRPAPGHRHGSPQRGLRARGHRHGPVQVGQSERHVRRPALGASAQYGLTTA